MRGKHRQDIHMQSLHLRVEQKRKHIIFKYHKDTGFMLQL